MIIGTLMLSLTASVVCAQVIKLPQTGQNFSYYPGDDGDLQVGVRWPSPRFTNNGNGTMTDNLTGLTWTKNANPPGDTLNWAQALLYVDLMNKGNRQNYGYKDWRMPNVNELESLLKVGEEYTSQAWLTSQGFKNVMPDYWTSTSSSWPSDYPVFVIYYDNVYSAHINSYRYLWPVRGKTSGPAMIWKTGQKVSYSTYFTRDDGGLQKGVAWPNPRFVDNENGTVTDRLTGLLWLKDANCFGVKAWYDALDTITDFNIQQDNYSCVDYTSSYTDWRLPNRKELRSLIDYSKYEPALPENHPFMNVAYSYWSSTSLSPKYSPEQAWVISTWGGGMGNELKSFLYLVWPVRGGIPLKLITPNGGETISSGSTYTIQWEGSSGVVFKVLYSLDNGTTWMLIDDNIQGTAYSWQVPPLSGNKKKCLVKVIGYNASGKQVGSDRSGLPFAIEVVELTSPNGGETLTSGAAYNIAWTIHDTTDPINQVVLFYTKNGGQTWNLVATLPAGTYSPGSYSYPWTVPSVGTVRKTKCKVKVVLKNAKGATRGSDLSDGYFTIQP